MGDDSVDKSQSGAHIIHIKCYCDSRLNHRLAGLLVIDYYCPYSSPEASPNVNFNLNVCKTTEILRLTTQQNIEDY